MGDVARKGYVWPLKPIGIFWSMGMVWEEPMGRGSHYLGVPGKIIKYVDLFLVVLYYDLVLSRVYWGLYLHLQVVVPFTVPKGCNKRSTNNTPQTNSTKTNSEAPRSQDHEYESNVPLHQVSFHHPWNCQCEVRKAQALGELGGLLRLVASGFSENEERWNTEHGEITTFHLV